MSRIGLDAGATGEGVCPTAAHLRVLRDDQADLASCQQKTARTGGNYSGQTVAGHTTQGLHSNIGFGQLPHPDWNLYGELGAAMAPAISVAGNRICYGRELVSVKDVTYRGYIYLPNAGAVAHEGGAVIIALNSDVDVGAIFSAEMCIQSGIRTVRIEALDLATLSVDPATVTSYFVPAKIGDA